MISTSPIKISCVIAADQRPRRGAGAARRPSSSAPTRSRGRPDRHRAPPHGRRLDERRRSYRVGVAGRHRRGRLDHPRGPRRARLPGVRGGAVRLRALGGQARSSSDGSTLECRPLDDETIQGLDLVLSSAGGSVSAEWAPKLVEAGRGRRRQHQLLAHARGRAAGRRRGQRRRRRRPQGHRRQPELHDDGDDGGAGADPPRGRARAPGRLHLPVGLRHRPAGDRGAARRSREAVLGGRGRAAAAVYPHQIAFNVLPQVENFKDGDDYTTEERKVMAETRKILGLGEEVGDLRDLRPRAGDQRPLGVGQRPDPRGPLARGLPRAARRRARRGRRRRPRRRRSTRWRSTPPAATRSWSAASAATPSHERCLNLWVVGDNLRKGAATNAVQVAELLVERDLLGSGAKPRPGGSDGHRLRRRGAALRRAARRRRGALGRDARHRALGLGALGGARDRCWPRPAWSTSTPTTESIVELVELALILTLFSDGMFVERELLRRHWSPVARALVIAMPITMALLALAAKGSSPT